MAKLERIVLAQSPDWDERMIGILIAVQERHGVKGPVLSYRASLIDRTKNETQPQYSIFEDEDLQFRAQCHADPGVDLALNPMNSKIIAAIGAALVVIGVFAPIMNIPIIGSVPLMRIDDEAAYTMLLVAVIGSALGMMLTRWFSLLSGLIICLYLFYAFVIVQSEIDKLTQSGNPLSNALSLGIGFAVIGLGAVLLIVSPWLSKRPKSAAK